MMSIRRFLAKALTDIQLRAVRAVGSIAPGGPSTARGSTRQAIADFRRALDDKHVDAERRDRASVSRSRVVSTGGRYHFADDWEFPDTQEATFEFSEGRTIIWQGQNCNGLKTFDRPRGTSILGTTGRIVLDRDGYVQYGLANQEVKRNIEPKTSDRIELTGDDAATSVRMDNFLNGVWTGAPLRASIADVAKSVRLCHLGNIALQTGRALRTIRQTAMSSVTQDSMRWWSRDYAPKWARIVEPDRVVLRSAPDATDYSLEIRYMVWSARPILPTSADATLFYWLGPIPRPMLHQPLALRPIIDAA